MKALREHCSQRLTALKSIRTDFEAEWNDIARFAQPARSRFLGTETNKGTKRRIRNNKLFDPHGIEAFRTLTNGMTSGLTSASRPWFTLKLGDEELNSEPGVRAWLSECDKQIYSFLAKTNFYGAAKSGYGEMGLFGTEACVMVEHPSEGAVCHSLTAGEYWIGLSDALVPDTLARECSMTARQIVQTFGEDKSPKLIRDAYNGARGDEVFTYHNLIEPNRDHNQQRFGSKPWRSIYWYEGDDTDRVIDVRGYNEQPFWAPRWDVVGGDTYGVSPGMEALPALRELQMQSKRRNEAIDKLVKPEMLVKQGIRLTGEPGAVRSVGSIDGYSAMPAYAMPYQAIAAIGAEADKCKAQIDGLSFADLFNAITNMRGVQPRYMEEIASRNEEKLTQLGPVIERVSNEKLEIVIDRVFGIMIRGNLLPPPPPTLADMPGARIDVEFVSILTQMQRAVGVGQIERAVGMVGNLAGAAPDVLDNVNTDEVTREYFERLGVTGRVLRDAKEVEAIRAQRAQQQQMAQAAEMMPAVQQGADAARLLSETKAGGQPVLDTLMGV